MGLFDDDGDGGFGGAGFAGAGAGGAVSPSVAGVQDAVGVLAAEDMFGGVAGASRAERGVLGRSMARFLVQVALRFARAAKSDQTCHPRTELALAGITGAIAGQLSAAGRFAVDHPDLAQAWLAGSVTMAQVCALAGATRRLDPDQTTIVVDTLLPVLPGLSLRRTKAAAEAVADLVDPDDPDEQDRAEQSRRYLAWTGVGGGIHLAGYLPAPQAAAFTAALEALVADLRAEDDGLTTGQRRADALLELVSRAGSSLPTQQGLPPSVTLTVSLTEAERIANTDPADRGNGRVPRPRPDGQVCGGHGSGPAGDAMIRFGLCAGRITPILHDSDQTSGGTDAPEAGSLLAKISRAPVQPLHVGREVRLATAAMRKALAERDGGCIVPDCLIPASSCQAHHVTAWALGGSTDLDNLALLCASHHLAVEHGTYGIHRAPPGQDPPRGTRTSGIWWITPRRC